MHAHGPRDNITDKTVKIPMCIIQEFGCTDEWIVIVQIGRFALLADGNIAEGEDISAQRGRGPTPPKHSPLISSELKTPMAYPYTIGVDTIRCGPRGDPTFRWRHMHDDGYVWWTERLRRSLELYDEVRLDHFLGFQSYFSIPAGMTGAAGRWIPGPGLELFACVREQLGQLPFIAEDLGYLTPAVRALKAQCGFPGIEVHAMHWGYLLDQFAMTFMNPRTDEYGGALENRLRCAREILDGVKAACGSDFVVSMRLALKSYIKGYNHPSLHGEDEVGRTLEEGLEIAKRLGPGKNVVTTIVDRRDRYLCEMPNEKYVV